jgi:hypothetical protein
VQCLDESDRLARALAWLAAAVQRSGGRDVVAVTALPIQVIDCRTGKLAHRAGDDPLYSQA